MSLEDFHYSTKEIARRLKALQCSINDLPEQQRPWATQALEGLAAALEELQVAEEELCRQTEELAESHMLVEAERQRYQELFNFAPDGYVVTDPQGVIQEANRAAAALFNIRQHGLLRKPLAVFIAVSNRRTFRTQLAWLRRGGQVRAWEVWVQPRLKPPVPVVLSCAPACNARGLVLGLRWLLRDISERRRMERALQRAKHEVEITVQEQTSTLQALNRQLRTSLQEKEVLLQEVQHRMKNNMQVIASLLNLQSSQIEDARIQELFRENQHRVRTMALIHETLYQSSRLAHIDLAQLTTTLCAYLCRSYGVKDQRITSHIHADQIIVNPETAIPYGMILNELVSNALKHALVDDPNNTLQIVLRRAATDQAVLTVRDHGPGLPDELNWQAPESLGSLGLRLVNALAVQLHGSLALDCQDGAAFTLTFRT